MNTISVGCNDLKVANEVINGLVREVSRLRAALRSIREGKTMFDYASPNKIAELTLNESEAK